ncbi:MAG: phenylalanine--tRNA ligase subunit beta, partial [Jiangellaceae bacterium]
RLDDTVLDVNITANRGDCFSVLGLAREIAAIRRLPLRGPRLVPVGPDTKLAFPVALEAKAACPRFAGRVVEDVGTGARTPDWLRERLRRAGLRAIHPVVDVTNYVMLELGQPIHGYDRDALSGAIVVRRATEGERLTTLDGVDRDLDSDDLLITDDSGPIGLAGVMGGGTTELGLATTSIVIEAANFEPTGIAHAARRHKLPSEASKRFERGVDPALPLAAATRVADLLVEFGGANAQPGVTIVGSPGQAAPIEIDAGLPARVVGIDYPAEDVARLLAAVGARVTPQEGPRLSVVPPSWRPDLTDPFDLVEEVARLHGYDAVPSVLPVAPSGRGITFEQRLRRRVERALAASGYVEAPSYPFVGEAELDALGLPADDARRRSLRLANPLSEEQPLLRTTLLPGLLAAVRRNVGRGTTSVGLYEAGLVVRPESDLPLPPRLAVDHRPSDADLAALMAAVPRQPWRVAVAACGDWELAGWWGPARPVEWPDAIQAARAVAGAAGLDLRVERDDHAPWLPGRCAALFVGDVL